MFYRSLCVIAVLLLSVGSDAQCQAQDPDGAGLSVSRTVTAEDVGLPTYPGARPYKEEGDSDASAQINAWAGGSGFKLAVVKLQSSAAPDKIKEFYWNALSKYGPVLDCKDAGKSGKRDDKDLTCDNDEAKKGETLLKAGTKDNQHEVAIKKEGSRTVVALLHIRGK